MPKDSGRTGRPGNQRGTPGRIHMNMKNPNAHLDMHEKMMGGGKKGKKAGTGGKGGRMGGY